MFSVIFPGQGSQMVGMGKEFYDKFELVKNLFKEADDTLNFSILVPEAKIFAPASLSFFIIALPIPPDAPVTMIFFFSKLFIFLNLQYLLGC